MLVAVGRPVARRNSAMTSRPENPARRRTGLRRRRARRRRPRQRRDGLVERPGAVRIERDARLGEALRQRGDGLDLVVARQHAALELEVVEAVARVRGFGEPHDGVRRQRFLVAQARTSRLSPWRRRDRAGWSSCGRRHRTDSRASRTAVALLAFARAAPPPARRGTARAGRAWPHSTAVTAWMVVRRSKVCRPRPPASRSANFCRMALSTAL